jgi:hypothetical protein
VRVVYERNIGALLGQTKFSAEKMCNKCSTEIYIFTFQTTHSFQKRQNNCKSASQSKPYKEISKPIHLLKCPPYLPKGLPHLSKVPFPPLLSFHKIETHPTKQGWTIT